MKDVLMIRGDSMIPEELRGKRKRKDIPKPFLALGIKFVYVVLLAVLETFTPIKAVTFVEAWGMLGFAFVIWPAFIFLVVTRANFYQTVIFLNLSFLFDLFLDNTELSLCYVIFIVAWLMAIHTIEDHCFVKELEKIMAENLGKKGEETYEKESD